LEFINKIELALFDLRQATKGFFPLKICENAKKSLKARAKIPRVCGLYSLHRGPPNGTPLYFLWN
jgi:hypothetical protein